MHHMAPRGLVDVAVHRTRRSVDQVRLGVVVAMVVALSATGLAACGRSRPTPDAAARAVAQGLASLNVAAVPFTGAPADAQQQLTDAVSGMGALRPSVSVERVAVAQGNADAASAVLAVRWDVDGSDQDWAYTTCLLYTSPSPRDRTRSRMP